MQPELADLAAMITRAEQLCERYRAQIERAASNPQTAGRRRAELKAMEATLARLREQEASGWRPGGK